MTVTTIPFGRTHAGEPVTAYCLRNDAGASVTVLDYGAAIQALEVPDRSGCPTDVVLGYDTPAEYEDRDGHLGGTIGRVGNRIGGGFFRLNGQTYFLARNDGDNHLHGGLRGFDRRHWTITPQRDALVATRLSPDGEEGYPGNLRVQVTVTLTEDNALRLCYDADADADTVVNLTNHSYFNLNGGGSVLDHRLQLRSGRVAENDGGCLPTGRLLDVADTPFDFRRPKTLGADIEADCPQLRQAGGYDHCFALADRHAAVLWSEQTGIRMTLETDLPGVQLYTANFLTPRPGKGGRPMDRRGAVCLETQLFPNALNCYGFPTPILRAGAHLRTETVFTFDTL